MKANELQLGDYVTFKDCQWDDEPIIIKIDSILSNGTVLADIDNSDALDEICADELSGIPITPEILEKNGFKQDTTHNHWLLCDDYYDILISEWSDSIWTFRYDCVEMNLPNTQVVFSFVHELQHALKLCRIEKTIKL